MSTPQQQPNGWHGTQARQGWFGDRNYQPDPRDNQKDDEPRRIIKPCKWCPIQIELNGDQWTHIDGGSCRSHHT